MVLTDRQAAIAAAVQGADVTVPDWYEERERFEQSLAEPPAKVDGERVALRRALGLPERKG